MICRGKGEKNLFDDNVGLWCGLRFCDSFLFWFVVFGWCNGDLYLCLYLLFLVGFLMKL